MRLKRTLATLILIVGVGGGSTCPNTPGAADPDSPGTPGAGELLGVKLKVENLSGLWVEVEAIYRLADLEVRSTRLLLEPSGPDANAEIVSTLTNEITIRAKATSNSALLLNPDIQAGQLLAARVFLLNEDFFGGETLEFIVPALETPAGDIIDCNGNTVADAIDIVSGASPDCDHDGIPDECETDTDSDGRIDDCDLCPTDPNKIAPGACGCGSPDVDSDTDGVLDCNDACPGHDDAADCNSNSTPDACDISSGASEDCNLNGIPDECDLSSSFSQDCNGNDIPDECEIDANSPAPGGPFYCTSAPCDPDCNVNGIPDECELLSNDCNENQVPDDCELDGNDCNSNLMPDDCELFENDCNHNDTPDDCELVGNDCNSNHIPDDCELFENDCNESLVPDDCELDGNDCNSNLIPDDCELFENDCNENYIPDDCELAGNDCNSNLIPDECELYENDCNENNTPDDCELAGNDCNSNNTPDDCELYDNDCNENNTPDDCELDYNDCDGSGVPDDCEVPPRSGPFANPFNLGNNLNDYDDQWESAVSLDGLTLYVQCARIGGQGAQDIWKSTRGHAGDPFTSPTNLGPTINSPANEKAPYISASNLELFFASDRSGGQGGLDLYVAARAAASQPFNAPTNLGATVNSGADDTEPTLSGNGLRMIFASDRAGGGFDLYECTRTATSQPFSAPTPLASLNSLADERSPALSHGGLTLIFASDRAGSVGGYDLWMASRLTLAAPFGPVSPVGTPINTLGHETGPMLTDDGLQMYFGSDRTNTIGAGDVWISSLADCNHNGQPDLCDTTGGTSNDVNLNTLPDECEPPGPGSPPGAGTGGGGLDGRAILN